MSILQPLDVAALMKSGHVTPTDSFGTRRVHKRRLYSSSDDSNNNDDSDDNAGVDIFGPAASVAADPFVVIPDLLVSEATLRFVGYRPEIAARMWANWTDVAGWKADGVARETDPPTNQMLTVTFSEFTWAHAEAAGRPVEIESNATPEQWTSFLSICGLDDQTSEAITDKAYQNIRRTASCLFWVVDTIQMRYRGLVEIQSLSRQREQARQRDLGHQKQESSKESKATQSTSGRSISGTQRLNPGIETATALSSVVASNAPGYTTLWKGVDQSRVSNMFDDRGDFVTVNGLVTTDRGDFSRREAFYFAVEKEFALAYAAFAKRRAGVVSVVLVRVQIPNAEIKSLSTEERKTVRWPDNTWKELIYHCRRSDTFVFPKRLNEFLQAMLIIGTISWHPNKHYDRLRSPNNIKETDLLHVDDNTGTQYVFVADKGGAEFLDKHGEFNLFPLTGEEEVKFRQQQQQ